MDRGVLREAARLSGLHQPYVLALIVKTEGSTPRKNGGSMLLRPDGSFSGTVGGARLEEEVKGCMQTALKDRKGGLHHFELRGWKPGGLPSRCGGSVEVAVEFVEEGPNVLIWGAGHTGLALARALALLSYDHSIADDRAEYLTRERFPQARNLWKLSPAQLSEKVVGGEERFSHVYLLGYDAKKDEDLLGALLPDYPGHIGLIASKVKRQVTFRALEKRGLSRERLRRVRSPVGLPIGAESPEEIAVSIAAEIVRDLNEDS